MLSLLGWPHLGGLEGSCRVRLSTAKNDLVGGSAYKMIWFLTGVGQPPQLAKPEK